MKPFGIWLSATTKHLSASEQRRWAERSGVAYSTFKGICAKHDRAGELTTAHRIASARDTYLADIIEWLEEGALPVDVLAQPRTLPVLHTDVLMDTQSPDALRYMFAAWVQSAIASYGLTPRSLSLQAGLSAAFLRKLVGPSVTSTRLPSANAICNSLQIRLSTVVRQLEHLIDLVDDANGDTDTAEKYLIRHAREVWPELRGPVAPKTPTRPRRTRTTTHAFHCRLATIL